MDFLILKYKINVWESFISQYKSLDCSSIEFPNFEIGSKLATRAASGKVIQNLSTQIPALIGGSADLAKSNKSYMNDAGDYQKDNYDGRNLHFGVREHPRFT